MINKKKDEADDRKRMKGMSAKAKAEYKKKDKAMDSLPGMTAKIDSRLDRALELDVRTKFKSPAKQESTAKKPAAKKAPAKKPAK